MVSHSYRALRSLALASVFVCAVAQTQAQQDFTLRGYGRVVSTVRSDHAVFECETAERADNLMGKLIADLFWDAGNQHQVSEAVVKGVTVTIHSWGMYGAITVARVGNKVIAVGAPDESTLKVKLESEAELLAGKPVFKPAKPYPRYFDMYDLRAAKVYTYAMRGNAGYALDSHWPFLKKFGLNIANQYLTPRLSSAEGLLPFGPTDYELKVANQNDGIVSTGLIGGGEIPLWAYNQLPYGIAEPSPTTLMTAIAGTGSAGNHYQSWGLTADQKAIGTLNMLRQEINRYKDSPAVGAWQLYAGTPAVEFSYHDRSTAFLDYSPPAQDNMRAWLRDVKKFDLPTLGRRWYNDPNRFHAWSDVTMPDVNSFYGDLEYGGYRLKDGWQFSSALDAIATPPAATDPSWIPVEMPPSQQQALLPYGEAFYRNEFEGGSWASQKECWIVCDAFARSPLPTQIWLNGKLILQAKSDTWGVSVSVAGLLNAGKNELIIRVPRGAAETPQPKFATEGKIIGPVFLTKTKPQIFPFADTHENARYVDFEEWQGQAILASHIGMLDTVVAVDPDRPLILSGNSASLGDAISQAAEDYGTGIQYTGRQAVYNPWLCGMGLLGGFYGTSEEGSQPTTAQLDHELGWMILDGDSNHCFFQNIDLFQAEEQKSGWFTKNQRTYTLLGKYLRAKPQVAMFVSARDQRLGSREPSKGDLGLGELQAAHIDNAYASETQLLNGEVDQCPVLIDAGTDVMDQDTLQAIEHYVERGGTFIAMASTGLHDTIDPKSQPLTALTGYTATPHANTKLRFTGESPLLSTWANRTFTSFGVGLTPANSPAIVPGSKSSVIAEYADGTVAIAERRIGKGRVIHVGASFWRDHGATEAEFLNTLLAQLGVQTIADATSPQVWTRKATTKNGLQDWLLSFNNSATAPVTTNLRMAVAAAPGEVWDVQTGQPVQATYANGYITLSNVTFEPNQVHVYGVKHADLAGGLAQWWGEKTVYWRLPKAASSAEVAQLRNSGGTVATKITTDAIQFTTWQFIADKTGAISANPNWASTTFDDKAWYKAENGPWNVLNGDLVDWHGAGFYRAAFDVPASWTGRKILLNLASSDLAVANDHAEFMINGKKVADYTAQKGFQAFAYDISSLLHPGANVLAVKVDGGKELAGINGNVWIEPAIAYSATVDLSGPWDGVGADFKTAVAANLPGKPNARYLRKQVQLPADWVGKSVFLHIETDTQWLGSVVVNGHLINMNSYILPFNPKAEVNLTPYMVAGKNRIELWPYRTIPNYVQPKGAVDTIDMPITAVSLSRS